MKVWQSRKKECHTQSEDMTEQKTGMSYSMWRYDRAENSNVILNVKVWQSRTQECPTQCKGMAEQKTGMSYSM